MTDPENRSEPHRRCAECGEPVGDDWTSFKEDPSDPNVVSQSIGFVAARRVAPPERERKRTIRDLRREDLGLVFHCSCAPRLPFPEAAQEGIMNLLADILAKDYERTVERWSRIRESAINEGDITRCRALVANAEGRRVFTMSRDEWERFKAQERRVVAIDIERTSGATVEQAAAVIAGLAAQHVQPMRIEVWPYNATVDPTPSEIQDYFVVEGLTPRQIDMPKFAERVSTKDTPGLRKYLRDHVFVVSMQRDEGRRQAKARAIERVVFITVK